jgi:hypothetical protein
MPAFDSKASSSGKASKEVKSGGISVAQMRLADLKKRNTRKPKKGNLLQRGRFHPRMRCRLRGNAEGFGRVQYKIIPVLSTEVDLRALSGLAVRTMLVRSDTTTSKSLDALWALGRTV